jgi:hypothetical protein
MSKHSQVACAYTAGKSSDEREYVLEIVLRNPVLSAISPAWSAKTIVDISDDEMIVRRSSR